MLRRFSQLVAQQPKSLFAVSSRSAGHRGIVGSAQVSYNDGHLREAFMESKDFDMALKNEATKANGNMTATGMYNWRVAAVNNALAKRGKAIGPLTVEDLTSLGHLDQYHYMGTEACDEAIDILGLDENVSI